MSDPKEDVTKDLDRAKEAGYRVEERKTQDGGGEPPQIVGVVNHRHVAEPCWPCIIVELAMAAAVAFAAYAFLRNSQK